MEKAYSSEVIKIAKSQVGYLEKASNKDLNDFKANAGFGNYTKYARDYAAFANANLQGQSWCAMFLNWCFVQAYGKDIAKVLLGGFNAYTPSSAQYFKNMKQWFEKTPKIGDVIYYKNSERICHVGLVINVTNTTVYTIEGNTSAGSEVVPNGGGVFEKQYNLSNPRIAGYGRPKYDVETNTKENNQKKSFDNTDWIKRFQKAIDAEVDGKAGNETLSKTPTIQLGTKGIRTKLLQEKLTALGYDTKGTDGEAGDNTIAAMKKFQKEVVGLKNPDGKFTAKDISWKVFLAAK